MDIGILESAGIDYNDGVARFAGKAEMYEKYLFGFPEDSTFGKLSSAMREEDYASAFNYAHALCGVCGNLSMNGFVKELREFARRLRDENDIHGAQTAFPELVSEYERVCRVIISAK